MNKTSIEWTDFTWNPVTGCNKVSQGCKNCYAETVAKRFWGERKFTDVIIHRERLNEPLRFQKKWAGKRVFVCSMSDLFHESVPFEFVIDVFRIFSACPDTIFQVLTKRPDRALSFYRMTGVTDLNLENFWLGTSCEDQKAADERIPLLVKIPATVRFLSCEPLIGKIVLGWNANNFCVDPVRGANIHWVIAGGESGHSARPVHPDWVRSLRDQCEAANVPFFFKQWGEWMPVEDDAQPPFLNFANGECLDGHGVNIINPDDPLGKPGTFRGHSFMDAMEALIFCVDHDVDHCNFWKCGKSKSGHLLDGKEHKEFPKSIF